MMKRTVLLFLLTVCLLLIGTAMARTDGVSPKPTYWVERLASSGGYQHSSLNWQISGTASSSKYQLISQPDQQTFASGCCCVYLPCVRRVP